MHQIRIILLAILLASVIGCSQKRQLERALARAQQFDQAGEIDKARIEYLNVLKIDPKNGPVAARLGELLFEKEEFGLAFQILSLAKELQPTNHSVRLKLGTILAVSGDHEKARKEAEAVLETHPAEPEAFLILAICSKTTEETDELLARVAPLAAQETATASTHLALGQLHQKLGNLQGAETAFQAAIAADPKDRRPPHALAELYWRQGDTNRAELSFKKAVELAPVKSAQRTRYAGFLLDTGRSADAKGFLSETLTAAPDFVPALNSLTEIALREADFQASSNYIAQVIRLDPKNLDALMNGARLKFLQGQVDAAIDDLQRLSAQSAQSAPLQYYLAVAHRAQGENTQALDAVERALLIDTNYIHALLLRSELLLTLGRASAAIPDLVRLTALEPRLEQPHYLLASAYSFTGRPQDALPVLNKAAALFPQNPKPHLISGMILRQHNKPDDARKAFEQALQIQPDFSPAIEQLIELDLQSGDHSKALARAQEYARKFPNAPSPLFLQARIFEAQKRFPEAEASLNKAIQLAPDFIAAHKMLVRLLISANREQQAISNLESILAKNPEDAGGHLRLALLYAASKQFEKAIEHYRKVTALDPSSVLASNNLAYLLSERNPAEALSFAQRARDLAPNDPSVADTLGWIAYQQGDYPRALAVLQPVAEKLSSEPEALYHFGMASYMNGLEAQARKALEAAVNSGSDFPGKVRASHALAVLNIDPARPSPSDVKTISEALDRDSKDFMAHLRSAQNSERDGKWALAVTSLEAAQRVNPKVPEVYVTLAALNVERLGNKAKGMDYARQAWALSQAPQIAARIGPLACNVGEYLWALPILGEALRAYPSDPALAYSLGLSSFSRARFKEAHAHLQQSLQIAPAFSDEKKANLILHLCQLYLATNSTPSRDLISPWNQDTAFTPALFASARLLEAEGNLSGARGSYQKIIDASPEFLPAQRQLALLLSEDPREDKATSQLLVKIQPHLSDDPALKKAAGKLAFRSGDFRQAARLLGDSKSAFPQDADLLYHLGLAQYHLKDAQAGETLTAALSLEASSRFARDARDALAQLQQSRR